MDLATIWFVLIAVLWSGYFLLEGFDFGVGMLLPVLPRDEAERSTMFESIGPVWDGNEVWLVVAGGATFAAFPAWYATMFSGFYLALLLILVLLIVRVVSFEWRERSDSPRWRTTWRWANTVGSVGASFVWGVALANLVHGVPLNSKGDFTGNVLDLFSAYTVLAGIAVVALFALHGAVYLTPAHERGSVRARRRRGAATVGAGHRRLPRRSSQPRSPSRSTATTATSFRQSCPLRSAPGALVAAIVLVHARPQRLGLRRLGCRGCGVGGDDLHRPVSARARLAPGLRQQPDDLRRGGRPLRAERHHGRGGDLRPDRADLPGLDVPRLPGAPRRRAQRPAEPPCARSTNGCSNAPAPRGRCSWSTRRWASPPSSRCWPRRRCSRGSSRARSTAPRSRTCAPSSRRSRLPSPHAGCWRGGWRSPAAAQRPTCFPSCASRSCGDAWWPSRPRRTAPRPERSRPRPSRASRPSRGTSRATCRRPCSPRSCRSR